MGKRLAKMDCVIACDSEDSLRRVAGLAELVSGLEQEFTDVEVAFPNGIEQKKIFHYKLRDYFCRIEVEKQKNRVLRVSFYPLPNAGKYWKDLVDHVITSFLDSGGASLTSVISSSS